jgi:divalent metal cation (Fe/Co/Zn/Cd) transporter
VSTDRAALIRHGLLLNWLTIAYNTLEAVVALGAGLVAGSVALVGFGVDSVIEVTASGAAQWRLRTDLDERRRVDVERRTRRVIGWSFLALAAYVTYDSTSALWSRGQPERSIPGIVILALSVVVMPALARAKRRVARAMASGALASEATQTSLCAYLSAIALAGVGLNALAGWWWADPVAALAISAIAVREGRRVRTGSSCCAGLPCGEARCRPGEGQGT